MRDRYWEQTEGSNIAILNNNDLMYNRELN